jgi:hypothetical protein
VRDAAPDMEAVYRKRDSDLSNAWKSPGGCDPTAALRIETERRQVTEE